MPLTIAGGRVVTPSGVRRADVVVEGAQVAGLVKRGGRAGDQIEADGCYVLPGGIDTHTHLLSDAGRGVAMLMGELTRFWEDPPEVAHLWRARAGGSIYLTFRATVLAIDCCGGDNVQQDAGYQPNGNLCAGDPAAAGGDHPLSLSTVMRLKPVFRRFSPVGATAAGLPSFVAA